MFGLEKKSDEFFFYTKEKLYEFFEKNQFRMLLYYGINLLILLLLLKNFSKIENFYKQLSGNVNDYYKFIILIPLSIFAIYIGNYKIVHKGFNKNLLFVYSIFTFQIFSIDTKNNTINGNIVILILTLFMILLIVSLYRISQKNEGKFSIFWFWIIIIIELVFQFFIFSFIIKNQIDIFKIAKEIYIENKRISNLEYIYFIFKLLNLILLIVFVVFKIFPNAIEKNDLKRIEKISNSQIDEDKIKGINNNNEIWKFKNQSVKEEFISNVKRQFGKEYDIYYKKDIYYFCLFHFLVNIQVIKWLTNLKNLFLKNNYENYRYFYQNNPEYPKIYKKIEVLNRKKMVIIDKIINNRYNFKDLKNQFDMLVILSLEEDIFESRSINIRRLKKEISLGEKSILIDDNWGNGKTFFIKKFMEIYNKDFEFIYIKVPYFDNKKEFRKKILTEIYRVFKKNKIITSSLKELMSYFNVNIQKFDLGFISFDFNKLLSDNLENDYSEILIDIKKNLAYLEKKIIIILDDFDRVENKSQIIEVLNFIGELNIELSETITLITLSSYEKLVKILENEKVADRKLDVKKYLEKYFDKIFHLSNPNFFELVEFFSDIYNLNLKRVKILKEIGDVKDLKKLLDDGNITFRNVEKLVKNLKKVNMEGIEQKFKDIYEKVFIFWEVVEYLIPESYDDFKGIEDINIDENTLVTSYSLYNIMLDELKWDWKLDEIVKSEKKELFIHSILEAVRKYKLSKCKEPLSYYLNIRDEMLGNNNENKFEITYEDYKKTNEIFYFKIEEKKKIFDFLMSDKNISQCEILKLMVEYDLIYKWKYDSSNDFFVKLRENNRKKLRLLENRFSNVELYEFLKILLQKNYFIDNHKLKDFLKKDSELYSKFKETRDFLASQEKFQNFFKSFLKIGINNEYYDFLEGIFRITRDADFYRGNGSEDKGFYIKDLKNKILNTNEYLSGNLKEDIEKRKGLIDRLNYVKNHYGEQDLKNILSFLEDKDIFLYKEWKETINEIIQC